MPFPNEIIRFRAHEGLPYKYKMLLESEITAEQLLETNDKGFAWTWIAGVGDWFSEKYGKFSITLEDLDSAITNFKATGRKTVLDYDHDFDNPLISGKDKKASGEIMDMEVRGEQLFGLVDWTPDAVEGIKKGDYRYFSPTYTDEFISKDATSEGEDQGFTIIGGGITPRPFIDNQPRIAANELHTFCLKENQMDKEILEKLGLKEGASKEEVINAIAGLQTEKTAVIEADAKVTEAETKVTEAEAKTAEVEKELKEEKAKVITLTETKTKTMTESEKEIKTLKEEVKTLSEQRHEDRWIKLREHATDLKVRKANPYEFKEDKDGKCTLREEFDKNPDFIEGSIMRRPEGYVSFKEGEQGANAQDSPTKFKLNDETIKDLSKMTGWKPEEVQEKWEKGGYVNLDEYKATGKLIEA